MITIKSIVAVGPCDDWPRERIEKLWPADGIVTARTIADSPDVSDEDTIWILVGLLPAREARLFACWCCRQIWHLLTDQRSRTAVEVAERYTRGQATDEELAAAWAAAQAAAQAAARDAARDAARAAARAAARDAAQDAAQAAAWAAARDAARAAARAAQKDELVRVHIMLNSGKEVNL